MPGSLLITEEGRPLIRRERGLSEKRGKPLLLSSFVFGTTVLVVLTLQQATRTHSQRYAELLDANKVFESAINVMPTRAMPVDNPSYPGVTDADQSPQLPVKFLKEEEKARKDEARMLALEERQQKREDGINARVNAISAYVNDEVSLAFR